MKSNDPLKREDWSFLETFGSIEEEKDWQKVRSQMKQNRTIRIARHWKVAAVIVTVLGLGYLTMQLAGPSPETMRIAAVDGIREVTLPDGSLVILNRGSSLNWPEKFRGKERSIILKGEAWFEVESDPSRPFIVELDRADVEVLGTRFNVKEDSLNGRISVQVEEGRVAFSGRQGNVALSGSADQENRMIMKAGEAATMNHHGVIQAEKVDPNELGWRTGILVFEQHTLEQVAAILEACYGTPIDLDPAIEPDLEFTSTIVKEELAAVLEELCLVLGLNYKQEEGRIFLLPEL